MFDTLFRYPAVLRRHRDGPFATERAAYLAGLAARGHAPGTVLKCARYCLARVAPRGTRRSRRAPMTLASAVETYAGLKQSLGAVFSVDARIFAAFVRAVGDHQVWRLPSGCR